MLEDCLADNIPYEDNKWKPTKEHNNKMRRTQQLQKREARRSTSTGSLASDTLVIGMAPQRADSESPQSRRQKSLTTNPFKTLNNSVSNHQVRPVETFLDSASTLAAPRSTIHTSFTYVLKGSDYPVWSSPYLAALATTQERLDRLHVASGRFLTELHRASGPAPNDWQHGV